MYHFKVNTNLCNNDHAFAAYLRQERALSNFKRQGNTTIWRDGSNRIIAYAIFSGMTYKVYTA